MNKQPNICSRCHKEFKYPYLLEKHKQRKYPCKEAVIKRTSENLREPLRTSLEIVPISKKNDTTPKINCKWCKMDIYIKNVNRHHRESCIYIPKNIKNAIIEKYNKNKKHLKSLQLVSSSENNKIINNTNSNTNSNNTSNNNSNNIVNNNSNNNNITNNNITVKINAFGEENTDFLTKKDKLKLINRCYMSVPELIKKIHDRPENRNLYMPNLNKNLLVYLNKKNELEYNNYDEVCERLISKNILRIDDYFAEFENELKKSVKARMIKVLTSSNNGEQDEKYMEDIKYYLMTISKKNKKDLNSFIDKLELKMKK